MNTTMAEEEEEEVVLFEEVEAEVVKPTTKQRLNAIGVINLGTTSMNVQAQEDKQTTEK